MNSSNIKNNDQESVIIWAIDPTQSPTSITNIVKEIQHWSVNLKCKIQPVSIFSNMPINFPSKMAFPWKDKLEEAAQKSVDQFLKNVKIKNLLPTEKIFIPSNSRRKMVITLAKYAEKKKALIIFANTRAKKSWIPFRLGGFVETLIAISRIPVLLLNPQSHPTTKIPSILFPTDFNRESKIALLNLVPWAKAFKSKILLYSQIETMALYMSEFNGYWPNRTATLEDMTKRIENARQKKAIHWTDLLQKQGIKTQILIDRQRNSLGADILDVARKNNVSLIALASRTGPTTQALLGSIAREILFHSKCPILVFYRPKILRTLAQKNEIPLSQYASRKRSVLLPEVQHG